MNFEKPFRIMCFSQAKNGENRIRPCCDSIDNAFLHLFNQL